MSTNATISVEHKDGTVNTVYLHWDGNPEHALETLKEHYNAYDKVANLCSLGDMSSLRESADCPVGHSFDTAKDGYTIFYGRDRGETDVAPRAFNSVTEMDYCEAYNYLFRNGKWEQLYTN